jgi:hypothetical protein
MFIAALFINSKIYLQPRCPPTGEWINVLWYICTMKYKEMNYEAVQGYGGALNVYC